MLDWNLVLPSMASTHRKELHLQCGAAIVFFCPQRCVGMLWRGEYGIAQITAPITAPEFVRAVLARGIAMPTGAAMLTWSAAITGGIIETDNASAFLLIPSEIDRMAEVDAPFGARH